MPRTGTSPKFLGCELYWALGFGLGSAQAKDLTTKESFLLKFFNIEPHQVFNQIEPREVSGIEHIIMRDFLQARAF